MNLRLDFAGGLALWQGLVIGVLAALITWRWYRRNVRQINTRWARVLLPALRALTIFGLLACLTGPVLTHRRQEGQLGRVLVFVDGSQSMGLTDEHLDTGRKLLIAAARGAASTEGLDLRLAKLERRLSDLGQTAAMFAASSAAGTPADQAKRFLADLDDAAQQLDKLDPAHLPRVDLPRGHITAEYFDDLPGSSLSDLTSSPKFAQGPSQKESRDIFESHPGRGDNYGTRMRGLLYAPLGGNYTFLLNSDDDSVLFISPDADPLKKKPIARVEGFTPYHQWDVMPAQKSAPIRLEAGRSYYIEALHKEGSGEDYVGVGWDRPDGKQERPIPGTYLAAWEQPALNGPATLARLRQDFDNEVVQPAHRWVERNANRNAPGTTELAGLAENLRRWQARIGTAFAIYADDLLKSGNARLRKAVEEFNTQSRWRRAETLALGADRGFLAGLAETHHVELMTLRGADAKLAWDSVIPSHQPETLPGAPDATTTDLSDGIRAVAGQGAERMAVVLLSDGRHNDGAPPLELAKFLGARGVPIHTVGLGNPFEATDLAILEIQGPQSVYADDRVKGHIILRDLMPPGLPFTLALSNKGRELWKQELMTDGTGQRTIEFDFAAKEALAARIASAEPDVQVLAEPITLQALASTIDGESRQDNNAASRKLMITRQSRRILLIDGRPRWETRFIRDLFDRDHQWHVDPLIQDTNATGPSWSKVDGPGCFPQDRDSLYSYGLIILGELPLGTLRPEELEWIRDFVEQRGGGLVLIDGQRGQLREYGATTLGPLIPIGPAESFGHSVPDHLELTAPGRQLAALRLENESAANATLWRALPSPHWIAPVRALEGTEVLAEAVCRDQRRIPLLVHRQVGAGQVLYCASDETWRWRYEVADRYQTRYWNQVANWLMEAPFAVKDRFVAVDAGGPAYQTGEPARVRVQLTDRDNKPLTQAHGQIVVYHEGAKVAAMPLEPDPTRPGRYRATSPSLPEGEYEAGVIVDSFSELETKARAPFAVMAQRGQEMTTLSCDESLLKAVAAESGGTYLREEEAGQLPALLKPLSAGRVVVTQTRLAESYWWFVPVILLLTVEWVIRKRIGLI